MHDRPEAGVKPDVPKMREVHHHPAPQVSKWYDPPTYLIAKSIASGIGIVHALYWLGYDSGAGLMLRTALLVVVTVLLAPMMPHDAHATLVFRFEPNNLQVPLPEPPQPIGLQAIDAEIGIADEALSRGGILQLSDLEYASFAYTPLPDEFGPVSPASFELGERFDTAIVPAGTEFEVRTGYASWTGVSISGDTLVFNPPGVFLSVADTCFDLIGQVFCEGSKGGAIITPLEERLDPALVTMLIRDEFAACNEFRPGLCTVDGRFVLVDAATQIAEPPALAFLGLILIGLGLRQRAPGG